MRRSTKVGVALAVGVSVVLAGRYQRAKVKRPPVQRTLFMLSAAIVAQWWNPVSWFNTVKVDATDAYNAVKNWCLDAINDAFTIYDETESFIIAIINAIIGDIESALTILEGMASTLVSQVGNIITHTIPDALTDAYNFATNSIGYLYNEASGWVANAVSFLSGLITDVENAATFIFDAYIVPAVTWIENAVGWAESLINAAWDAFYNAAIAPIVNDVTTVINQIDSLWNFVFGEATTIVHAVEAAWDWVVWFGEHTFDDLDQLFTEGDSMITGSWVKSVAAGMSSQASDVESMMEQILGS